MKENCLFKQYNLIRGMEFDEGDFLGNIINVIKKLEMESVST